MDINVPKPDEIDPAQEGPNEGIDMSEAGPTDMEHAPQDAGLKICFIVKGKKSYQVGIESPGGKNASGDQYQEFDNSADALREVMRLVKENPRSDDSAMDQLHAGFGSGEQKY